MSAYPPWSLRIGLLAAVLGSLSAANLANAADDQPEIDPVAAAERDVTQGALRIVQKDGGIVECPLKHTDVTADVAGFIARVRVTQTFHNPTKEKIEAVYVFPLPHEAAVDDMTMQIGERKIVGQIKRRAEARSIYEAALAAGQTTALLEQERPNIFTQSVGNIEAEQEVKIVISYVDVLKYDMGSYEFRFPMVVGPRYIPGSPSGGAPPTPAELQGKVSPPVPDTDRVPDASRISPPVLRPGVRNGHDISLAVNLNAGVPIQNLTHPNHQAEIAKEGERTAAIKLAAGDSIPNKDFVLRYDVVGKKPEMALLAHTGDYSGDRRHLGNGYFMLMIQPQEDERLKKSPPRELVFLVDVSGSMSGEPTNKVIEAMQGMLKLCRPIDTVQVITFASQAQPLFEKPVPVNEENIAKALGFTSGLRGGGGTEMLKGVQLAIDQPIDKERLRIVVMLTDGYIGNEAEIIEHVGKHCGDQIRFWCVGIGSAPNMFLVDGVAKQGGGMGKSLGLQDESLPLVQEITTRIQRAQLAKVKIDWGVLKVKETYPAKIPELWAGRPVIVYGRYDQPDQLDEAIILATVKVNGSIEGEEVSWPLKIELPLAQPANDVLAKVWARQKVEDLMQQTYYQGSPAVEEMVTGIALDYKLMSQYTSFVAVDSSKPASAETAKPPRRMLVPVPLPAGTRWEGFFGDEGELQELAEWSRPLKEASKKQFESLSRFKAERPVLLARQYRAAEGKMRGLVQDGRRSVRLMASASPGLSAATGLGAMPAGGRMGGGGFGGARGRFGNLAKDGYFGRGGVASRFDGLNRLSDSFATDASPLGDLNVAAAALSPAGAKLAETAKQRFEQATGKEPPKEREALRSLLIAACMLDSAAANVGATDGSIAEQAIAKLEQLHEQDVKDWAAKLPALQTKLDLVIRNQSLAQAIAAVAKAAKIDIKLEGGSIADATALAGGSAPRVSYLDLRHATVSQALDWILQPARLTWSPSDQGIVATSSRRQAGNSGWVYDVSAMSLPAADELAKLEHDKAVAAAGESAEQFLKVIRQSAKATDENSIVWFAPGELLVLGTPETHAAVGKTIETLRAGTDKPGDPLGALAVVTRKRFAAHKEKLAKVHAAQDLYDTAVALDHFSWQLLAAAAAGKSDLEALTELQIAWQSPQAKELLGTPGRSMMLRSLWSIASAARSLPADKELSALASSVRKLALPVVGEARSAAEANRTDIQALVGVLYASLAEPQDADLLAKALPLFAAKADEQGPAADVRTLARLLVGQPMGDDAALVAMISRDPTDVDSVALLAIACHRAGGDTWQKFRAASHDTLARYPLPGELVVLVNRLAENRLQVASAK
jgi:Ca-activated chloride channel family protein